MFVEGSYETKCPAAGKIAFFAYRKQKRKVHTLRQERRDSRECGSKGFFFFFFFQDTFDVHEPAEATGQRKKQSW